MLNRALRPLLAACLATMLLLSTGCSRGREEPQVDTAYWQNQVKNQTDGEVVEPEGQPEAKKNREAAQGDDKSVLAEDEDDCTEGEVVTVLESAPVQLVVKTETGNVRVLLSQGPEITRNGKSVHWNVFKGGERIKVTGDEKDGQLTAATVEILR